MTALPPEIVAALRANADATLRRHQRRPDGRCAFCAITWRHTDTTYPCPPVRIASRFLLLTDPYPASSADQGGQHAASPAPERP